MPPLRRMRIWSPRPSAATTMAHSLNAVRMEPVYGFATHASSRSFARLPRRGPFPNVARNTPMNSGIRFKLFLMMVLEFFIWGAWLPLIFGYLPSLGFSASNPPAVLAPLIPKFMALFFSEQSLILNAFPIAAIIGMFFSNQFADRNFAAERFLGRAGA